MSVKRTDPRTEKTRRAIREAFAELLMQKELQKITVQEIADLAEINRVTFYKHYLDIYDLYDKVEADLLIELGLQVLELEHVPQEEFYANLIGYISKNRPLFRMVFSPNATGRLREKMDRLLTGLFRQMHAEQMTAKLTDQELDYLTCYRTQGCLALLSKWVTGGFAEPDAFIAELAARIDRNTCQLLRNRK